MTGLVWVGAQWVSLEEGLPDESLPAWPLRETPPSFGGHVQDLQLLQQRGNAPYFIVSAEICEFVSSPGGGAEAWWCGEGPGAGKSFTLTHLLEEQRQLLTPISPGTTSCDCSWIYSVRTPGDFLLESLNQRRSDFIVGEAIARPGSR